MYTQNILVLSLGTNQGDKKANIQNAIDLIHNELGTVVQTSPLYEFPAWGFESESFYNCVIVVQCYLDAPTAMKEILAMETRLGRVRTVTEGYTARTIDIDIICFNEEVYDTSSVTIPHPLMQERRFVLEPAVSLNYDWKHPILKKTFKELLRSCSDNACGEVVGALICPLDRYSLSQFSFIAIEGNIGAGKTTLTSRIAEDFNAKTILEGFADNPFLPKFYQDSARYAFPLEMSFLADRYSQLSDDLGQLDLFKDFIIADYYIYKSLIFAQITLEEDEFRLYKQVFDIMYKETPQPNLYVFLYQNTERLLQNIQKRGRSYEADISATYLDKVSQGYLSFIKTLPQDKVLVIDISEMDFVVNQKDYITILDSIQLKVAQSKLK